MKDRNGRIIDKSTIEKYIKVGQTLNLTSQSRVTKSAQTEKQIKKTVREIVIETKFNDAYVYFKGDTKIYAMFVIGGIIRFRWKSPKREYIWFDGGEVKESLIEKYLER